MPLSTPLRLADGETKVERETGSGPHREAGGTLPVPLGSAQMLPSGVERWLEAPTLPVLEPWVLRGVPAPLPGDTVLSLRIRILGVSQGPLADMTPFSRRPQRAVEAKDRSTHPITFLHTGS